MKAHKAKVGNPMRKRILRNSMVTLALIMIALLTTAMVVDSSTLLSSIYVKIAEAHAKVYWYEKGLPWAEEAIRMNPTSREAHLISGYLNFKLLYTDEAIAAFERTIELEPSNFEAYDYLGIIYRGGGEPGLGIDYFNQAMQVADTAEELSTAYADRGLAYGVLQDYDQGFSDLDTALTINPDNGWAVFFKGNLEKAQAQREAAQESQAEVHEELAPSELETMLNN
jgi:tetratricopeptide (TPR) repeat protein